MRLLALLAIIERAGVAFPYDCEGDGTDNDDDDDYVKNGTVVVGIIVVGLKIIMMMMVVMIMLRMGLLVLSLLVIIERDANCGRACLARSHL